MTRFETMAADWLTVGEARDRILGFAAPLPVIQVPLDESLGFALARPLHAALTLPPWANSAMDGYAVRGQDIASATPEDPCRLTVVGEVRAGALPDRAVGPNEALRIMTGAPVPVGADSVVRVEDTDAEITRGRVAVFSARDVGRNVRPAGEDMVEGEAVLSAGQTIGAGQIGVMAALGQAVVPVVRAARVGVLPNGDELTPLHRFDEVRGGRSIPETNGHTLVAAVRELGAQARHLGIALDSEQSVEEHVLAAVRSDDDVLITAAGASMGESDLFKRVLDRIGFSLDFWRVKMRPGSPVSFGVLRRPERPPMPVFGLPGNPASAFVTFHILVRPFLLALAGHTRIHPRIVSARTASLLRTATDLTHFFRVRLEADDQSLVAHLTGPQGSGLVHSLGTADGLAIVPEGTGQIHPGEAVDVVLLPSGAAWGSDPGFSPERL